MQVRNVLKVLNGIKNTSNMYPNVVVDSPTTILLQLEYFC